VHQINNKITNYGERITNTLHTFLSSKISWLEILRLWWRCHSYGSIRYCLLRDVSKTSFTEKLKPCTLLLGLAAENIFLILYNPSYHKAHLCCSHEYWLRKPLDACHLATSAFRCLTLARRGMKGLQQPEKWENMWHRLLQLQWYSFRKHTLTKYLAQVVTRYSCT
jgi:hypothetical protein